MGEPDSASTTPVIVRMDQRQLDELALIVGSRNLYTIPEEKLTFATDGTDVIHLPAVVVEPDHPEAIQELLRFANRELIPVTPRGAGSGLSGGALAIRGGILLSMLKFDRILEIDPVNMTATLEPGVINCHLQDAVAEQGLFYPPDPASRDTSTLGGNVAEDAGGSRCYKYGTTRNYILALDVVLPDGSLQRLGVTTRKGVVGYDLKDLLIGSEGTLGVITSLVVRLLPLPAYRRLVLAMYDDFTRAITGTGALTARGIIPSALEFMDETCIELTREELPLKLAPEVKALLLVELDGSDREQIDRELEQVAVLLEEQGALEVLLADSSERQEQLWDVRRAMSTTIKEKSAIKKSMDVAVPVSRMEEYLQTTRALQERFAVRVLHYGHLADGNVHTNVIHMTGGAAAQLEVEAAVRAVLVETLAVGGTISGEHGIGTVKQPYIAMEIPPRLLELQKAIKRLFDPNDILNPGKIFV